MNLGGARAGFVQAGLCGGAAPHESLIHGCRRATRGYRMPELQTKTLTALVVDDEPTLLQLLGEVLEEAGFTPTCFGSGAPALTALTRQRECGRVSPSSTSFAK
jgi:hypothetical protein